MKGIDQRHDREVGRKGIGGVLRELRQEGEQIGRARETQFFNRQKTAQLKRKVVELQPALSELAAPQAAMTKLSVEEKDAFAKNKQDLEDGIDGVRT